MLMHSPDCYSQSFVSEPSQEPRRSGYIRGGAQGFDEKYLYEVRQDNIPRWPLPMCFFGYQLHQRRQPALTVNMHPLRQQ